MFTSAYNSEKTLHRCINSILKQTYSNFSYYLLDNGSFDYTKKIIEEYAKRDSRIIPLFNQSNQSFVTLEILKNIFKINPRNGYFCILDADDEYSPDFLNKMLTFANKNNLDVATCGTDWINSESGKLIRRKIPDKNIILEGQAFATKFPIYRNFMVTMWGGLYSIDLLRMCNFEWYKKAMNFSDTAFCMEMFRRSKRAGVYAESLHKYYNSPKTVSYKWNPNWFQACKYLHCISREYLLDYGGITKENEEYLYVLFLILIKYILPRVQSADVDLSEKLKVLCEVFTDEMMQYVLNKWSNIGIYSNRTEFFEEIRDWIYSQNTLENCYPIACNILTVLNSVEEKL